MMFSALVVEDHDMTRSGTEALLEDCFGARVLPGAATGMGALESLESSDPDLLVLDLGLPRGNGLRVLREVENQALDLNTLVLTEKSGDRWVSGAFRLGASGYVLKSDSPARIVGAVQVVLNGGTYLSDQLSNALLEGRSPTEADPDQRSHPSNRESAGPAATGQPADRYRGGRTSESRIGIVPGKSTSERAASGENSASDEWASSGTSGDGPPASDPSSGDGVTKNEPSRTASAFGDASPSRDGTPFKSQASRGDGQNHVDGARMGGGAHTGDGAPGGDTPPSEVGFDRSEKLTPREREILYLVAEGLTSEEIGEELCISYRTVEKHRENMKEKLGLDRAVDVAVFAARRGLLEGAPAGSSSAH